MNTPGMVFGLLNIVGGSYLIYLGPLARIIIGVCTVIIGITLFVFGMTGVEKQNANVQEL